MLLSVSGVDWQAQAQAISLFVPQLLARVGAFLLCPESFTIAILNNYARLADKLDVRTVIQARPNRHGRAFFLCGKVEVTSEGRDFPIESCAIDRAKAGLARRSTVTSDDTAGS